MIKTLTLDGLTSVKIKESAYDMARFCWLYNHSDSDIYASCVNSECTENADEVRRIPAGEFGMLDTESYETLYLNGSGTVEIVTSALLVCPFDRGGKGGGSGGSSGGMKLIGSYAPTYSGTSTSGSGWSDEIELPIDLYENNRTLLIRTKANSDSSTSYSEFQIYSMIKIEIPYDIYDTGKYQDINSPYIRLVGSNDSTEIRLRYYPETNKFSVALFFRLSYLDKISLDVYDMGVIE